MRAGPLSLVSVPGCARLLLSRLMVRTLDQAGLVLE